MKVALLSRFLTNAQASEVLAGLADGTVDVVVGTHRLLGQDVTFTKLGLLVVDEEQRFGVSHKESIKAMAEGVDVLTLTASPIPRTLEMALTGIRDLSMVNTPPAARRPILTHVGEFEEAAASEAIRRELLREGQVFYVHNRVQDIEATADRVRRMAPEARVAVAHGQMDEGTLEQVVLDFWQGAYDVLVCTTIVESGIDMPTVNTLVVDRADLLGLGQLHQLRGRVGRAGHAGLRLSLPPGRPGPVGDGLRAPAHHRRPHRAGLRLQDRPPGPADPGGGQPARPRPVGPHRRHRLRPVRPDGLRGRVRTEGRAPPRPLELSVDLPDAAHLPPDYVEAEDVRLEAYRRLSAVRTVAEVEDVRAEWQDRFGPLPAPATALLEVALLRVECLRLGVEDLAVSVPRFASEGAGPRGGPGGRAVAKLTPVILPGLGRGPAAPAGPGCHLRGRGQAPDHPDRPRPRPPADTPRPWSPCCASSSRLTDSGRVPRRSAPARGTRPRPVASPP